MPFDPAVEHLDSTDELEELAASYALGSIDPDERSEFARHVSACRVCSNLAAEFSVTADAFADTLEPVEASAGLKGRVLDGARAAISPATPSATPGPAPNRGGQREGWLKSIFGTRPRAFVTAAALIVIGALVAWNVVLQLDSTDKPGGMSLATAQFLYDLQGTDAAPGTFGAVYRASDSVGLLLLNNLPQTGPGEVYQAWRIKGSTPLPEDTFQVSGAGSTIVSISADLADADTIGITVEPEGGSQQPTGPVLLLKAS